jgi:hypothetical protein
LIGAGCKRTCFDIQKILNRELLAIDRILPVILDVFDDQAALIDLAALLGYHGVLRSLAGDCTVGWSGFKTRLERR